MNPKSDKTIKTSNVHGQAISQIPYTETAKARQSEHLSVDASTLPSKNHEKLTEEAIAEAEAINSLSGKHTQNIEKRSRVLIQRILLVHESFEAHGSFDEEAFGAFVKSRKLRAGGKRKNPWQRVVKLCMPKDTDRSLVSKYGYVVAALVKREIRSDTVLIEFDKPGTIEGNDREYTGLERFVRLHKQDVRPPEASNISKDPFENWSDKKIAQSAFYFLRMLYSKNMINDGIEFTKILKPELLKGKD